MKNQIRREAVMGLLLFFPHAPMNKYKQNYHLYPINQQDYFHMLQNRRYYNNFSATFMDTVEATLYPRYLPQRMPSHQPVTVVGMIVDLRQKSFTLQSDSESKSSVNVEVPNNIEASSLKQVKYIEVRGIAGEGGSISMRQFTDLKENFDLKTYNEMVNLASKEFRKIFNYEE